MNKAPRPCLPPRAPRAAERRLLPLGTCDTHMHVFGPPGRFPLSPQRGYTPAPVTLDDYEPVMQALGIERAVVVQPSVYGSDNAALLEALARWPERLRGVVVVDSDAPDATLRAMDEAGVRGIRINRRNPGGLSLDDAFRLAVRIAPLGWHIQLQVELSRGVELAHLAAGCPVPLVLDHFGFLDPRWSINDPSFRAVLRLLETGTFWVKMSAPYRLSRKGPPYEDLRPFMAALLACRPDRLLWATDWPHTELWCDMPDDFALAWAFDDLMTQHRDQVLVENPARLYGFPLPLD